MLGEKLMTLRKKQGYSQQELADLLSVTRQTISNWECNQGAPSLDKAIELARIYNISLDDLAENTIEVVAREKKTADNHVLRNLIGKTVNLDMDDLAVILDDVQVDKSTKGRMKILDVSEEWLKVEYVRTKENSLFKKETIVKLIELSAIDGFELLEV